MRNLTPGIVAAIPCAALHVARALVAPWARQTPPFAPRRRRRRLEPLP